MYRKRGFIATSLIYSFFLAFIAIFASLLASYIANKTILDRFNTETIEDLNNPTYSLKIYAVNANIEGGVAFTNLVSEPDFESLNYWTAHEDTFTRITNYEDVSFAIKKENNSFKSSIDQDIFLLNDTKYYFRMRCKNLSTERDYTLNSYLNKDTFNYGNLNCNPTTVSWKKIATVFSTENIDSGMYKMVIGENKSWTSNDEAYYTGIMLINLTDSYGRDQEPNVEWLDKNLDYFSDSVSFTTLDKIEKGDTRKIRFGLFKQGDTNMNRYILNCGSNTVYGIAEVKEINNKAYGELEIAINRDTTCRIEWSVP